jgi:hypothetical protein
MVTDSSKITVEPSDDFQINSADKEEKCHRLRENIVTTSGNLIATAENANDDLIVSNSHLDEIHKASQTTLDRLSVLSKQEKEYLDTIYDIIDRRMTQIVIITPILFYLFYFILFGGKLDWPASLGIIITVIEYFMFGQIQESIRNRQNEIEEEVAKIRIDAKKEIGKFDGFKETQQAKTNEIIKRHRTVGDYLKLTSNLLKSYDPTVQALYKERELRFSLKKFTTSLHNSLCFYGYPIQGKSAQYLADYYSDSELDSKWLDEAARELAIKLGTPQQLIILAYADYTGNDELLKNVWMEIKERENAQFALVKNLIKFGKIEVNSIDQNEGVISGLMDLVLTMDVFTLGSFQTLFQAYYIDLAIEKKTLISSMQKYGVNLTERDLGQFTPSHHNQKEISADLIASISKITGISLPILELIRSEEKGEVLKKAQCWGAIKNNTDQLNQFSEFLLNHNCIRIPDKYINNPELPGYCSSSLITTENYSITEANRVIQESFNNLEELKSNFRTALLPFEILDDYESKSLNTRLFNSNSEQGCASYLSSRLDTKEDFILLLYYDTVDNQKKKKAHYENIRGSNDITALASLFLRISKIKQTIHPYEEIISGVLPTVLNNIEEFSVNRIILKITSYSDLIDYAIDIDGVLLEEGISIGQSKLKIPEIFNRLSLTNEEKLLEHLKTITEAIIQQYLTDYQIGVDWTHSIKISCLAYYLHIRRDKIRSSAIMEASSNEMACVILYHISRLRGEEERKQKNLATPLREIILNVINGKYEKGEFIDSFVRELESGSLLRINDLIQVRFDSVHRALERVDRSQVLTKRITTMQKAVKTFLNAQLNNTHVIRALNTQLISAYLITTSSSEKTIIDIVQDRIANNPEYESIIFIGKSSGRYTRLGLIPFELDFDTFCNTFEDIFNKEVQKYLRLHEDKKVDDFSIYIYRVYPSDDYFKQIGGTEEDDKNPIMQIRNLILEKYENVQTLELLATIDEKQKKALAFKHVVTQLFTDTTAYLLSEQKILDITKNDKLLAILNSKQFTYDLAKQYGCTGIAELSIKLYKSLNYVDESMKSSLSKEFSDHVNSIIQLSIEGRIIKKDLEMVTNCVYGSLIEIGSVMDAFADS